MHIQGFTHQQLTFGGAEKLGDSATRLLLQVSADDYPHITRHVRYHLEGSSQPGAFGFVLDLILDRLEHLAKERSATPTTRSPRSPRSGAARRSAPHP